MGSDAMRTQNEHDDDLSHNQKPLESIEPAAPPVAAADKPASNISAEPLKAEVSRTDAPGAGVSTASEANPAHEATPKPVNPAAAQTATTSEWSSAIDQPTAPADETVRPPRSNSE
jgi:hypothetical protein